MGTRILVWDIPTRLFHWLLAASFAGAYLTSESESYMNVHVALGYTMIGLIAFRVIWGLIGSRYARFTSFAFGPSSVLAYLKSLFTRSPKHYVGHNPAGSWMVYGLLLAGLITGATGYATYNEMGGEWFEELHEGIAATMLGLVIIHIAGVLISSLLHRENLVRSMITGFKTGEPGLGIRRSNWLIGAGLIAGVVVLWSSII